ncbi:hypothetical protein [Vreelandella indica]|tara:strand:- start:1215 stop:1346 length:132 start_codon:yes stop_codon:yes gene_type:complete
MISAWIVDQHIDILLTKRFLKLHLATHLGSHNIVNILHLVGDE